MVNCLIQSYNVTMQTLSVLNLCSNHNKYNLNVRCHLPTNFFSDSKAKMKENGNKHERKILAVFVNSKEKM